MKALLVTSLSALVLSACGAPASRRPTPVQEQSASVRQMIIDYDVDGEMDSACTAWAYAPYLWITARHCVEEEGLYTIDGRPAFAFLCHDTADVCAVLSSAEAPPLRLADETPAFGDPVMYIGYPFHGQFHHGAYDGRWATCGDDGECEFTAFTDGGASGAPLFNAAGEVVGTVVSSFRGRPYSFAVPVTAVRELFD